LLQEELQRLNIKNEGAGLLNLPKGTITLLVADPSACNSDQFASYGTGKIRARLLSNILSCATHDERQYTSSTMPKAKKAKYSLQARVTIT